MKPIILGSLALLLTLGLFSPNAKADSMSGAEFLAEAYLQDSVRHFIKMGSLLEPKALEIQERIFGEPNHECIGKVAKKNEEIIYNELQSALLQLMNLKYLATSVAIDKLEESAKSSVNAFDKMVDVIHAIITPCYAIKI